MTNYARGAAFERRVFVHLAEQGYAVIRSAGSHGVVDLVALKACEVILVQCKRNGVLGPSDWNALWDMANRVGATPVMARMPPRKVRGIDLQRLTGRKEGRGAQPMETWEVG